MLVLRNKNYRYQEKDFGLGDWISGFFGPKYKTVDTGMVVNGSRPAPITPGVSGYTATSPTAPPPSSPSQPNKQLKRDWELSNVTAADKATVMKNQRLKSAKKFDRQLGVQNSSAQKGVLQEVRARNQQGTTNLNVSRAAREKARLDLKTNEGVNVDAWSSLSDKAHNREYMAQRRMERAQRVGQSNPSMKSQTSVKVNNGAAKVQAPPPLIAAPSSTPPPLIASSSNIPNSGMSSVLTPSSSNLPSSTPSTPKPNPPAQPNNPKPNNPKPNNNPKPKTNPQTTSTASNATKTNFKMSTGGKIGTGAAVLGTGYLLYNHFKNKDKK